MVLKRAIWVGNLAESRKATVYSMDSVPGTLLKVLLLFYSASTLSTVAKM